ncbi:hypothetical protein PGTUg99_032895 [Puccinia graminis f. sp. tritici]|uniref:Uncharacterized protein n=1 Tax=Puccinia graminis f. sp. tritici TaxID=56615 RepID=A0A5B0LUF3_PUCGR|nr:hypothetical protein PGTUg99_032895 [Puccinia graminis f. sp. tritici]
MKLISIILLAINLTVTSADSITIYPCQALATHCASDMIYCLVPGSEEVKDAQVVGDPSCHRFRCEDKDAVAHCSAPPT